MYGKNFTQGNKAQARRWRRSGINSSSRRFKQYSLPNTIRTSNKTAVRHRYAIQHLQQRRSIGFMALHERKAELDFFRATQQSQKRANKSRPDSRNGERQKTKYGKLVWAYLVSFRPFKWVGSKCYLLASWSLRKMDSTTNSKGKEEAASSIIKREVLRSVKTEKITLSVRRMYRPIFISVLRINSIVSISVRRIYLSIYLCFPYPYYGHLLVLPLYTALFGE